MSTICLAERRALLKFVENETGPVVTLTDGPLDVYQGTLDAAERQAPQAEVYEVYQKMAEMGVINAGYIDKPGSEWLTRMLALTQRYGPRVPSSRRGNRAQATWCSTA